MVTLTNNWIVVSNDDPSYLALKINLQKKMPNKKIKRGGHTISIHQPNFLYYSLDDKENMFIPLGLYSYISDTLKLSQIEDKRKKDSIDIESILDIEKYKNMLNGITLREEQLIGIRKAIINKRGILELATGSGKTEIMCGIIKYIQLTSGECPTVLLLEPTINLQNSTIKRFQKYDIPACSYTKNRYIVEHMVNVAHPSSLGNDLENNSMLLDSVEILLGDECHHFSSDQMRKPTYYMRNLVMSIGVSASAISQDHIGFDNILDYDVKEALAISATGDLLMNVTTSDMVGDGKLAEPVLFLINNECKEELPNDDPSDWHNVSSIRLESKNRNKHIVNCAKVFSKYNRKVLILVNTIRWAENLMELFYKANVDVGASYGGGKLIRFNGKEFVNDKEIMNDFESGKISILIGTTHLYEGADIPNLDVIILAYGGKGERTQIQGIGRALRLTKNGRYAYIVDCMDNGDIVLHNHYMSRLSRYKGVIGIPDSKIFAYTNVNELECIFRKLEKIT